MSVYGGEERKERVEEEGEGRRGRRGQKRKEKVEEEGEGRRGRRG